MTRMGVNSDLPRNRRFGASSFEFRLFLFASRFRFDHPPLAYMAARARIRVVGGRPYTCARGRTHLSAGTHYLLRAYPDALRLPRLGIYVLSLRANTPAA
jgi:hypothetical protein